MSTAGKAGQLVYIAWVDSYTVSKEGASWIDKKEVESGDLGELESVGWIVREDEDKVTIVAHKTPHQYSGDMTIPRGAIIKLKVIRLK